MLIDFTISNFKSIAATQTLSMTTAGAKELPNAVFHTWEDIALLKVAVVYGANASGKSNLLEGLGCLVDFVNHGHGSTKIGKKIAYYQPFQLDLTYAQQATTFEVEFMAPDDKRYRYVLSFNSEEVIAEELYGYPKKQEVKLFIRKKGRDFVFGEQLKGAKKSVVQQLQPSQLFLSLAAHFGNEQMILVQRGLQNLHIIDTSETPKLVQQTIRNVLGWKDNQLHEQINKLLFYADTGVSRVELKEMAGADDTKKIYQPVACHPVYEQGKEVGEAHFSLLEESRGTQQVYGLGGALFAALAVGQTAFVDELDLSFHSQMTDYLIQLFYHPQINTKNAQLIFSTHDTAILQNRLFRRDQIWFAEKNRYGATSIYGLSEFDFDKVRANTPLDKWYLSGKFGALPNMREFEPPIYQGRKEQSSEESFRPGPEAGQTPAATAENKPNKATAQ